LISVSFAAFSKFAKFLKRMMALKGTKRPFKFDMVCVCYLLGVGFMSFTWFEGLC
jgi:hypothetical protein